jgi:hypothetical protein
VPPAIEQTRWLSELRARFASRDDVLPAGNGAAFSQIDGTLRPTFQQARQSAPARLRFPARATGALRVEDAETGAAIEVALEDASDAPARLADGYLVYRAAHASGATLLLRAVPEGVEDYLSFEERPRAATVTYSVRLDERLRGLRLVENTLELLDAGGAPRLRIAPPYVVGADGERRDAVLAVEGCAFERSAAPPWGRPIVEPGSDRCRVRVSWRDAGLAYPAVLDPRWTTTTNAMTAARQGHTATLLPNGRVLVAGGATTGTTAIATAELFDPATGTWAATASMTGARRLHAAVLLGTTGSATTSGKVLVSGGINGTTSLATAQLYSPTAGTWVAATNLNAPRHQHAATLLSDGRVLVAGGLNGTTVLNTAAVFNPASGAGAWTATSAMVRAVRAHTATLLSVPANSSLNNRVLVVGGNAGGTTSVTNVQLFNGTSWTATGVPQLTTAREGHTATALANGNVLITGGRNGTTTQSSTLLFSAARRGR